MPIHSSRTAKLLTASAFALAIAATPTVGLLYTPPVAHAEGAGGVPAPGPVPIPEPEAQQPGNSAGCQPGESLDPTNGNCVPTMTPIPTSNGDGPVAPVPTTTTGDTTSTIDTGDPADLVPNINGDPCSGYWESTVCLTENAPAVQPRSTISSSP
jgi:hypothetical protein